MKRLAGGVLAGLVVLAMAGLQGCGGGGSSSGSNNNPASAALPAWLSGVWAGVDSSNGEAVSFLATPSGSFVLMNGISLNQVNGTLSYDGTNLSGSGNSVSIAQGSYAPAKFGGTAVQSPAQMNLNVTALNGTFACNLTPDDNANTPVT